MEIELMPGDVAGTQNPMALGRGINAFQWFWSRDGESKYSHSLIITDPVGKTFESLWTIKQSDLSAYEGKNIIIARPNGVNQEVIQTVLYVLIREYEGKWYPFWRVLMHMFPPLAKLNYSHRPVCSELVALYEYRIGVRHSQWAGTNPDTLADEWHRWKNFDVIYEGVWS